MNKEIAEKIVNGCIFELRFGGEHTVMEDVEAHRKLDTKVLIDRITSALDEAVAQKDAEIAELNAEIQGFYDWQLGDARKETQ